jgi:hypothetical protein
MKTLAIAVGLAALAAWCGACKVKELPPLSEPWSDDFERAELGDDYYVTGGEYAIEDGSLRAAKGYNHPLWLRKGLPRDVQIEFDAWAETPIGDIKVELYGDGRSSASDKGAYTSTGYVAVFGGWSNSKSILARGDEHGGQLAEDKTRRKVNPGQKYHWKLVRKGSLLEWYLDGELFLGYDDPSPRARGSFAFANWEAATRFDNLVITPL